MLLREGLCNHPRDAFALQRIRRMLIPDNKVVVTRFVEDGRADETSVSGPAGRRPFANRGAP